VPAALASVALGQGAAGQLAGAGVGLSLNAVMLRYSRGAEQEADALGARLMANAGYNPLEMARFFEKLEAQGGGSRAPEFLSSHPNPGNRVQDVQAEIQTMPQRDYSQQQTNSFQDAKQRVAQLPQPSRRLR
jgi:beta-barrel assembly-enhancing protease